MTIVNRFILGLSLIGLLNPISTWAAESGQAPTSAILMGVTNAGNTLFIGSEQKGNKWIEDEVKGEARLMNPKGMIIKVLKSKRDEKTGGAVGRREPASESEVDKSLRGACGVRTYHRLVVEYHGGHILADGKYLAYVEKTQRFYPIPDPPSKYDPAYSGVESAYNDSGPESIVTWITIYDSNGNKLWRKKFGNARGPSVKHTPEGWVFRIGEYVSTAAHKARHIYIDELGRTVKVEQAK